VTDVTPGCESFHKRVHFGMNEGNSRRGDRSPSPKTSAARLKPRPFQNGF